MNLWMYLVSVTALSFYLLRLVDAQDGKPFFFIDFIDDSFASEPDAAELNDLPLVGQTRSKPARANEDKIKKDSSANLKAWQSNSSLNDDPSKSHNLSTVGDFLMGRAENNTMYNQSGNEVLFLEDFFSIFHDSQLQMNDAKEEVSDYEGTPAAAVVDISSESPKFSGVVPPHRMYLRAISNLVQYVMDTLFSITELASSRMCEREPSSVDYDFKPHRKIKKRDLAKADVADMKADTTSENIVTSDDLSTEKTEAPTKSSLETTLLSGTIAKKNHSEETMLKNTSGHNQQTSTKLADTTEAKVRETTGHRHTDGCSGQHVHSVTHHHTHNLPDTSDMLADYIPVSFVNKNQKGLLDDQEIYELQRTVRASLRESGAIEESSTPTDMFAVTLMIVILVAMLFGGAVLVFAVRKTFYIPPPAGAEPITRPLSTLA